MCGGGPPLARGGEFEEISISMEENSNSKRWVGDPDGRRWWEKLNPAGRRAREEKIWVGAPGGGGEEIGGELVRIRRRSKLSDGWGGR
jgi:hypothetical protein